MSRITKTIVALSIIATLAGIHYFGVGPSVQVEIDEGSSGAKVAQTLKTSGIIKSTTWFRLVFRAMGAAKKLKPGRYMMRQNMSSEEAVWVLLNTDGSYYIKLSIPEGWRSEQIAQRIGELKITNAKAFLAIVKKDKLEGRLFPSTYFFEKNTAPQQVADAFLKEYAHRVKPLMTILPAGLSETDVLTLASIIEREAVVEDERPMIAAVYLNRIKKGMRLEADPTVQYALGFDAGQNSWWRKGLTYADLKFPSPYNTYYKDGLPPGPIANPGLASISAALNPAATDALFFVADGTGRHQFTQTFNQHVQTRLRIAKQKKAGQ